MREKLFNGDWFEVLIYDFIIKEKIDKISKQMNIDYKDKNPLFLVIMKGGVQFANELIKRFDGDCSIEYLDFLNLETFDFCVLDDRHIIIVDDMINTGSTIDVISNIMKLSNSLSVNIAVLISKLTNRKYSISLKYKGFDVFDEYIVGYGLDIDGNGRNLQHIYKKIK